MGHAIDISDIPEKRVGGFSSFIPQEIEEFVASKQRAWVLKEYENANSARSTVSRINRMAEAEDLPVVALSRGTTVYLKRIKRKD
jgi:hypothetical protein